VSLKKKLRTPTFNASKLPSPRFHSPDVETFIEKYKRTAGQKKQIVRALSTLPCHNLRIIGISKAVCRGIGVVLNPLDASTLDDINSLLAKRNLGPMTDFQIRNSVIYGVFAQQQLDTVMVTTTGMLGSALKVCVQVDWIASTGKYNHASLMVEKLKAKIAKRQQKSVVVTQCSSRGSARRFWNGRLTHSTWANVYVGLMHIYANEMRIYEDAECMIS
jgi:hypothetical protein